MDVAKLSVDQLQKMAQEEKRKNERAKAGLAKAQKSAAELNRAAQAVAEISKNDPEL